MTPSPPNLGMDEEDWKTAFEIFQRAEDLPDSERLRFLLSATDNPAIAALLLQLHEEESVAHEECGVREVREPQTGDHIDSYEILERLGKGGMGCVYQARDHELNRLVSLKFFTRTGDSQTAELDGLLREARAASALNHPHIVTIYKVVRSGERTAISMEYIEGASLRELCRRGSLPVQKVIRYTAEIISALAATHRKGIVHRDIKPENIMVQSADRVKIVDFGTARTIDLEGGAGDAHAGTVRYFSPEQARGEIGTSASDIFSLGVVLYEIATGRSTRSLTEMWLHRLHTIATSQRR